MKTIHPIGLAELIARHEPLDLIDVRPRKEFDKAHIRGARSIPLSELRGAEFLRDRKLPAPKPVYLICRSRTLAGLASGILSSAGCVNAEVVDGGMESWEALGLAVVRRRWSPKFTEDTALLAGIAGFGIGLGLAVHEFFFLMSLTIAAVVLCPKIHSFAQRLTRQNNTVDLVRSGPPEDWAVPHATQFPGHLSGDFLAHPHHRVRFAECH